MHLPRFLYHFTNEFAIPNILKSGLKTFSEGEGHFNGIFMVDIENFAKCWNKIEFANTNLQTFLIQQALKGGTKLYCIKIPTDKLKSSIFIRSQNRIFPFSNCKELKPGMDIFSSGDKYKLYQRRGEAIEYIHTGNIPIDNIEILGHADLNQDTKTFLNKMFSDVTTKAEGINADRGILCMLRKIFSDRKELSAFTK